MAKSVNDTTKKAGSTKSVKNATSRVSDNQLSDQDIDTQISNDTMNGKQAISEDDVNAAFGDSDQSLDKSGDKMTGKKSQDWKKSNRDL